MKLILSGLFTHDVIVLADMTRHGDLGLRIRREIQAYHRVGYRIGLRHLVLPGKPGAILPDIQRCVREGLADLVAPGQHVNARLAIVFSPGVVKKPVRDLLGLKADKVVLVHDRMPKKSQMGLWFSFNIGRVSWAPTNRWVRAKLENLGYPVPIEVEDWRSIGRETTSSTGSTRRYARLIIGRFTVPGATQWPETTEELEATYPTDPSVDFRVLGAPPSDMLKDSEAARHWTLMGTHDITVERFVEALDVFMYFPSTAIPELPEAAIATAMASGKIVVLPPHLRPHFGPGALYTEPLEAMAAIKALFADEAALEDLRASARYHCQFQFAETTHLEKIEGLIGKPSPGHKPRRKTSKQRERILFVPSNGVGLGHAARLLAIARRLDGEFEPVFTSFGRATPIIESFGYTAEYIPSHKDIGADIAAWDAWLRHELEDTIRRHQPGLVVYDGNNPTPGLVNAALADGRCRLAWVRRAMCPAVPSPFLENARFFDSIIEPGEYAGDRDVGPTVARRAEVIAVPPIRLLDHAELLHRDVAIKRLGLSPDRPLVLLHLGAGANRDILDLIDRIVTELRRFDRLQIVIAEWTNVAVRMPHWPGTKVLRGFPISQYFNAFDFSVAAAGYNTFHEVLGFGLPTIFIANRHPSMDNQGARAEFAQDNSAGFDLSEDEMHLFPALCEAMLNEKANAFLRQRCATFDQTNGAAEAAAVLMRMMSDA